MNLPSRLVQLALALSISASPALANKPSPPPTVDPAATEAATLHKSSSTDQISVQANGVIWIALNKKGIGLHGTEDLDSIGRSASHSCVRLANWDIVWLATRLKASVPVSIY